MELVCRIGLFNVFRLYFQNRDFASTKAQSHVERHNEHETQFVILNVDVL